MCLVTWLLVRNVSESGVEKNVRGGEGKMKGGEGKRRMGKWDMSRDGGGEVNGEVNGVEGIRCEHSEK